MLNTIEEAIAELKAGKMIIVVDDESRENEGDFLMAARHATPEAINFMVKHGRGLVCAPITAKRAGSYSWSPWWYKIQPRTRLILPYRLICWAMVAPRGSPRPTVLKPV
jgi:hypothetical protein